MGLDELAFGDALPSLALPLVQEAPELRRIRVVVLPVHFHPVLPQRAADALQRPAQARRIPDIVGDAAAPFPPDSPLRIVPIIPLQRLRVSYPLRFKPHQRFHPVGPGEIRGLAEAIAGPLGGVQLPGAHRPPPVALGACAIGRDIPAGVKPAKIHLHIFGKHFLQGGAPGGRALRYAAVAVGQPRVAGQAAGGKGRQRRPLCVRRRQVAGDKPASPEIRGIILVPTPIGRADKQGGADLFARLEAG